MDVSLAMPIDVQLFVQTLLYAGSVLAGLIAAVPLGITYGSFGNQCILYGQASYYNLTSFEYTYGHPSSCNFAIYVMVICCIFYPVALGCYYGYATYKSRIDKTIASQMWVMPFILGTTLVSLLIFIAAIVISIGIAIFCTSILSGENAKQAKNKSCSDAKLARNFPSGAENFFNFVTVSQSAAWIAFLIWIVQLAFTVLRFIRNRRLRSHDNFPTDPTAPDTTQIANTDPTA